MQTHTRKHSTHTYHFHVRTGNSKTSCEEGFPSAPNSWDPNTGLGRPIWPGMLKYMASDQEYVASTGNKV